jgi:hypothetical protein
MQTLKWLELEYEQDTIWFNWVYFPQKDAYHSYDWELTFLYQLAQTIYSFLKKRSNTFKFNFPKFQ